jgi:hypothetical protein
MTTKRVSDQAIKAFFADSDAIGSITRLTENAEKNGYYILTDSELAAHRRGGESKEATRWARYAWTGYPAAVRDPWASDKRIVAWEIMIQGKHFYFNNADDAMHAYAYGDVANAIPRPELIALAAVESASCDIAILEYALTALSRAFDEFVGECSVLGKAVSPSQKALMKARAALPPYCTHAFKPKETK